MKSTNYMKGLLFAESERQRLEGKGCNEREIYSHLTNIYKQEKREFLADEDWVEGFEDYRDAYLKMEV